MKRAGGVPKIIKPQAFRAGASGRNPRAGTSLTRPTPLQELPQASERPAGATRPSLTRLERPALPQSTPELLRVPPVENGSVYFIPYKYYLASDTMVFSDTDGWDDSQRYYSQRYLEFLRAMRGKISGSGYDETEAAVVCQIFKEDMKLMFCEKAIQEIRERGFGLTQAQKEQWSANYRKMLNDEKKNFYKRKTEPLPADFNRNALWFASFSDSPAPCLPSHGEHAGSIYFDGGRIRLMHVHGPAVKRGRFVRKLGEKKFLKKPVTAEDKVDLETLVQQAKQEGRPATLIEFGSNGQHTSRGYPKIVDLIDEDIAQLYYLADRISTVLSGDEDQGLSSQGFPGISDEQIVSAGNELMAEFIGGHARLKAALGYC